MRLLLFFLPGIRRFIIASQSSLNLGMMKLPERFIISDAVNRAPCVAGSFL